MEIHDLVRKAIAGDKCALEGVVSSIQDDIYYLALRMLANPDDAKDATQEILIKVITKLSTFQFKSQFKTWVFRVASNYLITEKKIINKDPGLTFDMYKVDLESDLLNPDDLKNSPEYQLMLNELRISCTMAMLLCLDLSHRMAYILGDIFEMEHKQASEILSISKANFRQQLSRARSKVVEFTSNSCGVVNSCARCSCEKKLTGAINRQRIKPGCINLANNTETSYVKVKELVNETQTSLRTLALHQSIDHYKCPIELGEVIESLVFSGLNPQY